MRFSRITNDFKIYKEKEIFLFGASSGADKVKRFMDSIGVSVVGILDNDKNKQGRKFQNEIDIMTPDAFMEQYGSELDNILIQISSEYDIEISRQLDELGVDYLMFSEWKDRFEQICKSLHCKDNVIKEVYYETYWKVRVYSKTQEVLVNHAKSLYEDVSGVNIMLSAPKVGNCTVLDTLKQYGTNIIELWHSYNKVDKRIHELLRNETKKLVIGIREPISQNLSYMHQIAPTFYDIEQYWNSQDPVQYIFDNVILDQKLEVKCLYNYCMEKTGYNYLVQNFFENQIEKLWGIDLYEYPFDKEKGYQTYHIGQMDIFVYQLERLNSIEKELGDFFGIENFKLVSSNVASDKWYHSYYEETKRDIKLSKKYYEECFNSRYIKHFYSEKDIEKFKKRWSNNVK